jgi:DNA-3-methyladenine glycosylase
VLLRAGDVVGGIELARRRRWGLAGASRPPRSDIWLARGPGNLGRALGLTLDQGGWCAGVDFAVMARPSQPVIDCGPRVGVSVAHQRPWRFWIDGAASVSAYKKSPRAVPQSW